MLARIGWELVELETQIKQQTLEDEAGQRLLTIPGIGPITASSLLAMAGDARAFKCGRDFAASLGLVPRQHSTGGRATLLGISKRGNKQLRSLLVQGARAVMRYAERRTDALGRWLQALLRRRHSNVVACALANKMARIVWAILAKGGEYRAQPAIA
ncbi:transposase [Caballeronia hypogeia]|uniref:Transposase n=1 Tax=Caballeronia hypogeia TaxID=1777140 RepID=A0A158B0P4_9BURK|nr:transposase [Caballeronia hypogeia]